MKNLISILFVILFSIQTSAQEKLSFIKVIPAEGKNNEALYVALRSFVATYYKDSKEVIQMDDKEACLLIGKATSVFDNLGVIYSSYEGYLDYTFKMQAKDGRVRIEITNFFHRNHTRNAKKSQLGMLTTDEQYTNKGLEKKFENKIWGILKKQAKDVSEKIFIGVEQSIVENETGETKEEEW